jgi:hypothetical protein
LVVSSLLLHSQHSHIDAVLVTSVTCRLRQYTLES